MDNRGTDTIKPAEECHKSECRHEQPPSLSFRNLSQNLNLTFAGCGFWAR
jgi:hypothetical protein